MRFSTFKPKAVMLGLQTNVFCDTGFILFSGFLKLDQFAVTFLYISQWWTDAQLHCKI